MSPPMRFRTSTGVVLAALATAVCVPAYSPPASARGAPDSFADLAQSLLPAVVNISSTQAARAEADAPEMPNFPPGSPFEQFFHDFMNRRHGGGENGGGDNGGGEEGGNDEGGTDQD